jgi:hypothetical protein
MCGKQPRQLQELFIQRSQKKMKGCGSFQPCRLVLSYVKSCLSATGLNLCGPPVVAKRVVVRLDLTTSS